MKNTKDEIIHLDHEWAIKGREGNLTLYKKRIVKQKGKLQFDAKGHYPGYPELFMGMVNLEITSLNGIQLIIDRLDKLENRIPEYCKIIAEKPIRGQSLDFGGEPNVGACNL